MPTMMRSILGAAVICGNSTIAWFSGTQKCVNHSTTTEVEFRGRRNALALRLQLCHEIKESLFVKGMLEFLVPSEKLSGIRMLGCWKIMRRRLH